MTEAYLDILSSKYAKWKFNVDPNEKVRLSISCKSDFDDALVEMLEIV